MSLVDALLDSLEEDAPVRRVLLGVHDTAICSRRCGLSSTGVVAAGHDDAGPSAAGRLHWASARELAEYARSARPIETGIGVAAINSLLPMPPATSRDLNAVDLLLRHGAGKRVALVGHFPFVERLRPAVGQLWVLERRPRVGDEPAERAPALIPRADVVAITAATLVNHTLDTLLTLCRRDAFVIVLGPSTPMWPGLFDFGVDALAGADVVDEEAALQAIEQAASFKQVPGVNRVVLFANRR